METRFFQLNFLASSVSQSHKTLKEEFVSNLQGSPLLEIAALSALVPGFMLLRQVGALVYGTVSNENENHCAEKLSNLKAQGSNLIRELTMDFFLVVLPTLGCLTVFSGHVYSTTIYIYLLLLTIIMYLKWLQSSSPFLEQSVLIPETHFLSCYRFVMMLVTCSTILAVDFNIFPRRFAKAETYGSGLMDLGVGSFVVANALVSRQARSLPPKKHGGIIRNVSPYLILGFLRLVLTRGVDYQVHVGEYGVHWNFFFTLASVSLLTSLTNIPTCYCGLLGVVFLIVYQVLLLFGLNKYLLSSERGTGLVSLNKEGLFSIFGYWSLYLVSIYLGQYLHFSKGSFVKRIFCFYLGKGESLLRCCAAIEIILLDAILWSLALLFHQLVENVSRRMCNMAYVIFVLAQNFQVMGIFLVADLVIRRKLFLQEVFEKNLLLTFLLANVLTGLVNMGMNTMDAPVALSMGTLVLYMAILVFIISTVEVLNLNIKFW